MIFEILKATTSLRRIFNKELVSYDLTLNQWYVLKVINSFEKKNATPMEIASELKSDQVTITEIINRLETKKYITKVTNMDDRRSKIIQMSDEMKLKCQDLLEIEKKIERDIFIDFTEKQKEEFFNYILEIEKNCELEDK